MSEKVNLIKLTKLERKVVVALLKPRKRGKYDPDYPKQGNDTYGLASIVYNEKGLDPYRNLSLTCAVKSSLSRVLNRLYRKGLVKKCKPIYRYSWHKKEGGDDSGLVSYHGKDFEGFRAYEYGKNHEIIGRTTMYESLPHRTKVWWILTEKGKNIAEEISGVKAERRKRLLERCKGCMNWYEKKRKLLDPETMKPVPTEVRGECEVIAMKGKELATEKCDWYDPKLRF